MSTTTQDPPVEAVAKDAHWAAKMERLRQRKPPSVIVTYLDEDTAGALSEAAAAVNHARGAARVALAGEQDIPRNDVNPEAIDGHKNVKAAIKARDKAQAAHDKANVLIELQGLPGDVYDELLAAHPPTEEQEAEGHTYNALRLIPELIAGSCTDPMTPREAATLIGGHWYDEDRGERDDDDAWVAVKNQVFSAGEAAFLIESAKQVNQNSRVSLGKGSGSTRG